MLKHALKEWAVVCKALAEGRQSILLRKGGIAEETGEFRVEHPKFWLYPTYVHQQEKGIQPQSLPLLLAAEAERPPNGMLRLRNFAEVTGVYWVKDHLVAQMLAHLHVWSDEAVRQRFEYREPGLYVLGVRVYQTPETHELPETSEYKGCRSWVELERALPTDGAVPVLGERAMKDVQESLSLLLDPTAYA